MIDYKFYSKNNIIPNELWIDVKIYYNNQLHDYNKYYLISNYGRVKSCNREIIRSDGRKQIWTSQFLKPHYLRSKKQRKIAGNDHLAVDLCKNGSCKSVLIHKIVMESFIGERIERYHIIHQDGNTMNNHLDNLKYLTPKEH